jgi:hypothetical protein
MAAPSVKHSVSVQAADDPTKSVNAAEWNADHIVSGVATSAQLTSVQADLSVLSTAVSVVAAGLSNELSARAALSAVVSSNAAAVSTLSIQATNISAAVSVVAANVSTLSLQVSAVSAATSVVAANVSTLSIQVSAVSAAVSVVAANLSALSVTVSAEQALRNTLSSQVTTVSAQTSVGIAAAAAASAAVSTLSLAVSVVAAQASTASVAATNASAAVSTLSLALSAEAALRNTLSSQVSTISAQMTSTTPNAMKVVLGEQTVSGSALANVSGMSFSVGANNTYQFKYFIIYRSASVVAGLSLAVTFPGMKTFAAAADIISGVDGTGSWFSGAITTSGTKVVAISCQTAATDFYATIEGICQVSTTGTVQLQAAAEIAGTSAQIIIRAGTGMRVWRMA